MRITSRRAYVSIDDLPIYNWFKVFETGNPKYIVIRGKFTKEELAHQWEQIFGEYVSTFGFSREFIVYFNKRKKLQLLKNKYALTKKAALKNLIKFREKELLALNPTENDRSDYMTVVMAVEDAINRTIDEKEISVRKFYTYLKKLKNGR